MTVTYHSEFCKTGSGTFLKLLLRWRGSIYKVLYKEFLIFALLFFALNIVYRFVLNESQRTTFEKISLFCEGFTSYVPLTFVLGFYVSAVVSRWWTVFSAIAWIDRVALYIIIACDGTDEYSRLIRRTIIRLLNVSQILLLRDICSAVKKRFPNIENVAEAGLLTEEEMKAYSNYESPHHKYWVPLTWCVSLVCRARKQKRIDSDYIVSRVIREILRYRTNLHDLLVYDWISIPLVYTQVVTIGIYGFFLASLMGRQYLDPSKKYAGHEVDLYIPIFTFLQFLFYLGWLKVAETIINPFGQDDDDFEINYIIDRNVQIGDDIVDDCAYLPVLERDAGWYSNIPDFKVCEN